MKSVFWAWTRNAAYAAAGYVLALLSVGALEPERALLGVACMIGVAVLADVEAA